MSKLIFDIGCNNGADTDFYLHMGYSVVAVDANPFIMFSREDARLQTEKCAITLNNGEIIPFHISDNPLLSSTDENIAQRDNHTVTKVDVQTRTLKSLFEQYGTPYYCKIDIEGHDVTALKSISDSKELPKYISCEAECTDKDGELVYSGICTLTELYKLGYTKFKLIDQETFLPLGVNRFYKNRYSIPFLCVRKIQRLLKIYSTYFTNKEYVSKKFSFNFTESSGLFGEHLQGEWATYEEACAIYTHNKRILEKKGKPFWCDWHATGVDIITRRRQDAVSDTRQFVGAASRLKRYLG